MTERVQSFGGEHTRRKLDVVANYLAAYVTVMKKQSFRLFYVDGFAGSGSIRAEGRSRKVAGSNPLSCCRGFGRISGPSLERRAAI